MFLGKSPTPHAVISADTISCLGIGKAGKSVPLSWENDIFDLRGPDRQDPTPRVRSALKRSGFLMVAFHLISFRNSRNTWLSHAYRSLRQGGSLLSEMSGYMHLIQTSGTDTSPLIHTATFLHLDWTHQMLCS